MGGSQVTLMPSMILVHAAGRLATGTCGPKRRMLIMQTLEGNSWL